MLLQMGLGYFILSLIEYFFSNKIDLSYGAEYYGDVFNKFSQTNPI